MKTKKFVTACILAIFAVISGYTQAPQSFNYQCVVRDNSGQVLTNSATTVVVSLLKGSPTGNTVYTETRNITSNKNGLINFQIGNGGTKSGTFPTDWATTSYYISVEVNGVDLGTSQLVSVPYALDAKTAESVDYNNVTNKPTYATVATSGSYNDLTNKPTMFSGSYTDLTNKPTLSTVATSGSYNDLTNKPALATVATSGNYNDLTNKPTGGTTHYVGEIYGGGVVFYTWKTGSTEHGLICAFVDQSSALAMGTAATNVPGARSYWDGSANTTAIIAVAGTSYAAGVARAYTGGSFNDWYLPSAWEWSLIMSNLGMINKACQANSGTVLFTNYTDSYWLSTCYNTGQALYGGGDNGSYSYPVCTRGAMTATLKVRAIRQY